MSIIYECNDGLYSNVTKEFMNKCEFCIRDSNEAVGNASTLWLTQTPSAPEVIKELLSFDIGSYSEIVFCGFGEPLIEISTVIKVARELKEITDVPIRINTNGLANMYHKRDITFELYGLIDSISISLNAKNANDYDKMCNSSFGEEAFNGVIDFIKCAKQNISDVTITVLDLLSPSDIEECRKIAEDLCVKFRVRNYIV